jgi:CheY-like chemotaxis protein
MPKKKSKPSLFGNAASKDPFSVLILDDERFDRHRLARLCSGLDFPCEVSNAKSLQEFATQLDQGSFHLILLDFALPDGTGLDALRLVQLSARNLNTPTLMVSGQAEEKVAKEALVAGCAGYLSKDNLTRGSFSTAVEGALRLVTPSLSAQTLSYNPDEVRLLLARSSIRCARDIKPMVSRLMRQMRDLRTQQSDSDGAGLQAIEQNCLSLWSFLVEMEREDGSNILSELATVPLPAATSPTETRPSKPPSPFTVRRH